MKDMLLLDDSKLIGDEYHAWKTIPRDAIFFEGHYPGNKILPGVFHLELASITANKFLCDIHKSNSHLVKVVKYRFFKSFNWNSLTKLN
jgi:3-hydroxymyristoyl/3-hydroxydecanoyl-(acyl carrier protein) dehydratase